MRKILYSDTNSDLDEKIYATIIEFKGVKLKKAIVIKETKVEMFNRAHDGDKLYRPY